MPQYQICSDETTGFLSLLADDPTETGLNRGGVFVEILTVQTHSRFESETVSGTETG